MTRAQQAMVAQFQRNARLAAERIERSPWNSGIRAARAEAELTGTTRRSTTLCAATKSTRPERWPR